MTNHQPDFEPGWVDELPRVSVAREAIEITTGDRQNDYGPPTQDFDRTAGMLNALGYRGPAGRELRGSDIARFLRCVKESRSMWSNKRDHFVDGIGYWMCGYECVVAEQEAA